MLQTYTIDFQPFEGPLDLLLQLIEKDSFDITKIALAEVTEKYLEKLERVGEEYPELLADFLLVAARLLHLKSQALLPYLTWEEDDIDLESQLKMYQLYYEAAKKLQKRIARKKFSYVRQPTKKTLEIRFAPPKTVTASFLSQVYKEILEDRPVQQKLSQSVVTRTIHIHEKIAEIKNRIAREASVGFDKILKDKKDTLEVVVSFLALLELVKQRTVHVRQQGNFCSITIAKLS